MFGCAISNVAKTSIRTAIKEVLRTQWSTQTLEWFADKLNPKIRGRINYYSRFNSDEAYGVFYYLNELIRKWIKNTFKIRGKDKLYKKYKQIQVENPILFYHWKIGVKARLDNTSRMKGVCRDAQKLTIKKAHSPGIKIVTVADNNYTANTTSRISLE